MKRLVLQVILLLIFSGNLFSQNQNKLDSLDQFVEKVMADWKLPGLAIAIVKDGEVIFSKGYGYENLEAKKKVTTSTLFSIASATKSFTAAAATMMVDEKKLNWDQPIITYFPEFKAYDDNLTQKLTIKDLLTHRSGVPRQKFFSLNTPSTRKEIREAFQYFEPTTDLRNQFQYCNETYTIAGDMIAELAGTTWEELVSTRILNPLSMNNTYFSIKDLGGKKDVASPYIIWDEDPEIMDVHNADLLGGAGCIITNIDDLSKWLIFNLNRGKIGDKPLINPRNQLFAQSPQVVVPTGLRYTELSFQNYGIGWFIDQYRGKLHVHHGGVLYGFTSLVSMLPLEKIGVVVLTNLNGSKVPEIIERYIYDVLTDQDIIPWNERLLKEMDYMKKQYEMMMEKEKNKPDKEITISVSLENAVGSYKSLGYGSMKLWLENDTLKTRLLKYVCPIIPKGDNRFEIYHPVEHRGWPLIIEEDENGEYFIKVFANRGVKPVLYRREEK